MSDTTISMIYIDNIRRPASSVELAVAFAWGKEVALFDARGSVWITGKIQGIRCESGYVGRDRPTLFLVDLLATAINEPDIASKYITDIFVHTN